MPENGSSPDLVVLGAGISGLSTAIALQAIGCKPCIVANYAAKQTEHLPPYPSVPTDYAMASAYPHNLRIKNLEQVSAESQKVFELLCARDESGVRIYRLFELFESQPDHPPLADARMKFQAFEGRAEELKSRMKLPCRPGAENLWGWYFDSYFADMPIYLLFLWDLFKSNGGQFRTATISNLAETGTDLARSGARVMVNCLGQSAISLCQDQSPHIIMRGKQVMVPSAPLVHSDDGLPFAYNYTATADLFPRADGSPEYLHFFPRLDGWILGQTREAGSLDADGKWTGPERSDGFRELNGVQIPEQILSMNEAILSELFSLNLKGRKLIGREGYRYYRDPTESGVRLELEEGRDLAVVHNYGHGGSGITMSWGAALECARLISPLLDKSAEDPLPRLISHFSKLQLA